MMHNLSIFIILRRQGCDLQVIYIEPHANMNDALLLSLPFGCKVKWSE